MLNALLHGFCCGLIGFVFAGILPNNIGLWGWFDYVNRLPDEIGKPLGACCYCFSGQVALWSSMIAAVISWSASPWYEHLAHVATATACAVTVAYFIFKAYRWQESK